MKNIKEISRKSNHIETGFACGPIGFEAIDAEITIEVDGQIVYLLGQWESETGEYAFEATKESIYDIIVKNYDLGSDEEKAAFDALDRIRAGAIKDEVMFQPYYDQLTGMIHAESCVLLERVSNRKADSYVKLNVKMEDYYRIKDAEGGEADG